jgi:hypothetical protein
MAHPPHRSSVQAHDDLPLGSIAGFYPTRYISVPDSAAVAGRESAQFSPPQGPDMGGKRALGLVDCFSRGWRFAAFVNFPSIYNRFSRRGDAEANSVTLDGDDGDEDIVVNNDLLTDSARKHKHLPLRVENESATASQADPAFG